MDRSSTRDWLEFKDLVNNLPISVGVASNWIVIYNQFLSRIEQIGRMAFFIGPRQMKGISDRPSSDLDDYDTRFKPKIWLNHNRIGSAFRRAAGLRKYGYTDESGNIALRIRKQSAFRDFHPDNNILVEASKDSIGQAMRTLRKGLLITYDYVRYSEWPTKELGMAPFREENSGENYTYRISSYLDFDDDDHFSTVSIMYGKIWFNNE